MTNRRKSSEKNVILSYFKMKKKDSRNLSIYRTYSVNRLLQMIITIKLFMMEPSQQVRTFLWRWPFRRWSSIGQLLWSAQSEQWKPSERNSFMRSWSRENEALLWREQTELTSQMWLNMKSLLNFFKDIPISVRFFVHIFFFRFEFDIETIKEIKWFTGRRLLRQNIINVVFDHPNSAK